jgi:hypothetical protein
MGLRFARRSRDLTRWALGLTRVAYMEEGRFLSTTGRDDSAALKHAIFRLAAYTGTIR